MYRYPVEEAFRFHFKSPRDISPRRDDVRIPKPVYYSYRNGGPSKPAVVRLAEPTRAPPDKEPQNKVSLIWRV